MATRHSMKDGTARSTFFFLQAAKRRRKIPRIEFEFNFVSMGDVVGTWQVALSDGIHKVEFEHGTTSGKRVIRVDNKEIRRHDWLFKLVGKETFSIGKHQCTIHIEAVSGFAYEYSLDVDGKSLQKFSENRSKISRTWTLTLEGEDFRIVLEKDTLDLWINGQRVDANAEFIDEGTETHFDIKGHPSVLKAISTGYRRAGINHVLFVDGKEVPVAVE